MIYLFRLVQVVSQLYFYCILANVILSWIPHNRFNPIFRFIHEITDPYLNFFQMCIRDRPCAACFGTGLRRNFVGWHPARYGKIRRDPTGLTFYQEVINRA